MTQLIAIIAIIAVTLSGINSQENAHRLAVEAAKAGLQQCVVQGRTVWQKECE